MPWLVPTTGITTGGKLSGVVNTDDESNEAPPDVLIVDAVLPGPRSMLPLMSVVEPLRDTQPGLLPLVPMLPPVFVTVVA